MLAVNLSIFIFALILLTASGSLLVRSLANIAKFMKVSEYVIGFILLAFVTSLPEFFVGISSALHRNGPLILGTIIGSNIADLTIIIGIPILIAGGMRIKSKKTVNDSLWMIAFSILPLVLMAIGNQISRLDGIMLISVFLVYVFKLFRERKDFKKISGNSVSRKMFIMHIFMFLMSLALLYASSEYVVNYASLVALDLYMPVIFIGLFMVAFGTSLPELMSGISAVMQGRNDMSIGNIVGSVVANSSFILGFSALIYPITADIMPFLISILFMIAVSVIFTAFIGNKRLSWPEGVVLIMLYILFLILEFFARGALW